MTNWIEFCERSIQQRYVFFCNKRQCCTQVPRKVGRCFQIKFLETSKYIRKQNNRIILGARGKKVQTLAKMSRKAFLKLQQRLNSRSELITVTKHQKIETRLTDSLRRRFQCFYCQQLSKNTKREYFTKINYHISNNFDNWLQVCVRVFLLRRKSSSKVLWKHMLQNKIKWGKIDNTYSPLNVPVLFFFTYFSLPAYYAILQTFGGKGPYCRWTGRTDFFRRSPSWDFPGFSSAVR